MADEEVVVSLTIDARASAEKLAASLDSISNRLTKVVQETDKVSDAATRVSGKFSGLGRLTEKIANDLEPWGKAARAAEREFLSLTDKIESLKAKMSRTATENNILTEALKIVPQVKQKIDELKASTLEAAKAQNQFTSPEYLNRLAQAQIRLSAYGEALGRFKVQLDNSIVGINSFANAQQMLANSASRMTSEWNNAAGLLESLTREFNPGILAAQGMTEKMQRLSQAYKLGVVDADQYAKKQRDIVNSFNTVSPAAEKLINDLKRLQSEQNKFQAQMVPVAPSSNVGQQTARSALQDTAGLENIKRDQELLAKSTKDVADRFDYLTAKFNQDATAANNYRRTIKDLNELMSTGTLNYTNYNAQANKAIDVYNRSTVEGEKATKANKGLSGSIHEVGLNTRVAQYAMTNFSFQINDVVSGLAMGQQPFRIFAQQAGQFVQIFQQIGKENIGQFFKDIRTNVTDFGAAIGRWLITPVGAAVTALGLFTVGTALVIGEVLKSETRIRSFGIILRTMGTDGLISAKALDEVVRKLRDTGSAASEANAAVQAVLRTPGINPTRAGDITNTARNISAARGISLQDAASGLAGAIAGGADDLTKYAQSLGVKFNPVEQKAIELAILHRDKIEQLRVAYGAIVRVVDGEWTRSLTTMQKLINELTTKWNDLLHALGETSWFQTAIKGVTELGTILTAVVKGEYKIDIELNPMFLGVNWDNVVNAINEKLAGIIIPSNELAAKNKQLFESRRNVGRRDITDTSVGVVRGGSAIPLPDASILGEPGSVPTVLPSNVSQSQSRYSTGGLKIDTDSLQKLAQIIAEASKALPEGYSVRAISTQRPGAVVAGTDTLSEHGFGRAIDNQIIDPQGRIVPGAMGRGGPLYQQLDKAVEAAAAKLAPDIAIAIGSRFSRRPDAGHYSLGGQEAVSQAARENRGGGLTIDNGTGKNILTEQTRDIKDQVSLLGLVNRQLVERQAIISATAEAQNKFKEATNTSEDQKAQYILEQKNLALKQFDDQLNKNIKTEDIRIKGLQDETKATMDSSAEQIKARAVAEANNQVRATGIPFEIAYRQALATTAAEAVKGAAEQINSQKPVLTGMQQLAEAAKIGGQVEHDARVEAEARMVVQKALDAGAKEHVGTLLETAKAQILAKEAAQNSLAVTKELNKQADTQQVLQLQIGLQGRTSEEINRQVVLMQRAQELQRDTTGLTQQQKEAILQATDATQRQVTALGEAQRAWGRIEDMIRGIADTIAGTLTRSIEDAFNGNKVESWGTKIRSMLASLSSQIVSTQFIKPAIGTILSGMGLTNLAQQYGTFGSGSGLSGLLGGSTSTSTSTTNGTITLTPDGKGGFSVKQLGDVAGVGKGIFDLFGSSGSSSSGGILGGLFGSSSSGLTSAGTFFGDAAAATNAGFIFPGTSGSTFAAGGAAAESGGFLSGIFGESVGGALGGIGSAVGSVLPVLGIGLGIASLFGFNPLDMIFGKSKPSNSGGGTINLSAGTGVTDFRSEGNAANNPAAQQLLKSLSGAADNLSKLTGGQLSGALNPQVFTDQKGGTVYKVGWQGVEGGDVPEKGEMRFASEEEALSVITLGMARSLKGISAAMKQVISTIDDPKLLEAGIAFAKVYDDIKTAFDSAFTSIPNDLKKMGPFETAMKEIGVIFDDLKIKAEGYGLSLEPIDAALEEANKRLREDFDRSISDAILGIQDPLKAIANTEVKAAETRLKEAEAIGVNADKVRELNSLIINDSIGNILTTLDGGINVLGPYAKALGEVNILVDALRQELVSLGVAADEADTALAGAKKRLVDSFDKDISSQILEIKDPGAFALQKEKDLGQKRLTEAEAIGADVENVKLLNKIKEAALETKISLDKLANSLSWLEKTLKDLDVQVESIFSSIAGDLNKIGPFSAALKQLNDLFSDARLEAEALGEPIYQIVEKLHDATERLTGDFNRFIDQSIKAITDPLGAIVDAEKQAGAIRLKDAIAVGGDINSVNRLNALTLEAIWKQATQTLSQLAEDLKVGTLAGLAPGASVTAANDNFAQTLALVNAGVSGELGNLATRGQGLVSLSQTVYGNAPKTSDIRANVLSAVEGVLNKRSFAIGTESTPSGWIQVHKDEWINQTGGNTVLKSGQSPNNLDRKSIDQLASLLTDVLMELKVGNSINKEVGNETINKLSKVVVGVSRKTILTETPRITGAA